MAGSAADLADAAVPQDRIAYLGHATVLIELDGVRLLTDPLLRHRVAHLRRQVPQVDRAGLAGLDAVLISHLHHDHVDLASLRLLGSDLRLLVPAGAGAWLRRAGFTAVTELAAGEHAQVADLEVTATRAGPDGRRPGGPRAGTLGFVVRGQSSSVYFAGDTELFDGMRDLPRGLDAALLPVAGWGPTLGPGHMDPLQAAQAAALVQPRIAIPMHWGTLLPLGLGRRHRHALGLPPRAFADHVGELAPAVEVRILDPGEATQLAPPHD